jgi:MYXO-CTERM domain-containing protein
MRRAVAFVAGVVVCLAAAREARAQATLVNNLGGTRGYGTNCIPPNDDGSDPLAGLPGLDLTPAFPQGLHFYSGSYTKGWINNNGSLSFKSAISTYTPDAFPGAPQPMIAPYWADVDTRDATYCDAAGYPSGGAYPVGTACMDPTSNSVWWSLTPGQMVVTWDQVGFYHCHVTPVMSFQMILTAAGCGATSSDGGVSGIDFDIEFRYNQCGWEAGDASGGSGGFCPAGTVGTTCTPAQAGFDSAEVPDMDYASLPISRMAGISTELCTQSNLTPPQPGVWRFKVQGGAVECPTAGQPCTVTGAKGICAAGQIQCTANGAPTCVSLTGPQPSQCNGLDNNCDGVIDTGPCPMGDVCSGSQCVPECSEGTCPVNWTCQTSNICIENDCIGVNCPTGADGGMAERCVNGQCVAICSGITCPIGQVCRLGDCVNPCAGLNCGTGEVCENGICVPNCPCTPCAAGTTCVTSGPLNGQCVANDCLTVNCAAGTTCEADAGGACIDDCTGAVCPPNQICMAGNCVPHMTVPDAGMGLMQPDGGFGNPTPDGGLRDGSLGDGSSEGADSGITFGGSGSKGGCGCHLETSSSQGVGAGLGLGLAALALLRRRRR